MKSSPLTSYSELFKATLAMFNLDRENTSAFTAADIRRVFKEVLDAHKICSTDFESYFKEHKTEFEEEGIFAK